MKHALPALCSVTLLVLAAPGANAQEQPRDKNGLTLTFGAYYGTQSSLAGGASTDPEISPLLDIDYSRGRFFASTERGIGFNAVDNEAWTVGLGVGYDLGRKQKDDRRFRGLGDVDSSVTGVVSVAWRPLRSDFWTVYAAGQVAAEKANGRTLNFGTVIGVPLTANLSAFVDVSAQWNDRDYMQTYYGVTALQSVRSGYRPYRPDAGLSSVSFSVGLDYTLGEHWSLGAAAGADRLAGDAKDSPIYDKETRPNAAVYASYRF